MTIRQLSMLKAFDEPRTVEQALDLNQLIFGTLCLHKWVAYDHRSHVFVRSKEGTELLHVMSTINDFRKNNNHTFSSRVPQFRDISRELKLVATKKVTAA